MKTPWMRTALAAVLCSAALGAQAQISDGKVRVMVLTDLSSVYSDTSGKGSVGAE